MKTKIIPCVLCIAAGFLVAGCEGGLAGPDEEASAPDHRTRTIGQYPGGLNVTETR